MQQHPQQPPQQRRKNPIDKSLPAGISAENKEAALYNQMVEFERRLDATLARKLVEVNEQQMGVGRGGQKVKRSLRIYTHHLVDLPPKQADGKDAALNGASWTFCIQGKVVDPSQRRVNAPPVPKFSTFLKSIVLEIQRPDGNSTTVHWNKTAGAPECDGFELKATDFCAGVKVRAILLLEPNDHFKLSPPLAEIIGEPTETLPNVIRAIWEYVKHSSLQDGDDKRFLNCDARLQTLFSVPRFMFPQLPELLSKHLLPLDPVSLEYTVSLDKSTVMHPYAYDLVVSIDDPLREAFKQTTNPSAMLSREIALCDDRITALCTSIHASKLSRDFYKAFSADPVTFLNRWIESQAKDLAVVVGDVALEETMDSGFFERASVKEAVFHYMSQH